MKYCIVVLFIAFTACKSTKGIKHITYSTATLKVKTLIPSGFKQQIRKGSHETEYRFVYPDSSMIYITDEEGTPTANYENIDNDSIAIQKSFLALMENDTLTLEGKDKLGRVWKNRKLKEISIGYLNVPEQQKNKFDKAIKLLKVK